MFCLEELNTPLAETEYPRQKKQRWMRCTFSLPEQVCSLSAIFWYIDQFISLISTELLFPDNCFVTFCFFLVLINISCFYVFLYRNFQHWRLPCVRYDLFLIIATVSDRVPQTIADRYRSYGNTSVWYRFADVTDHMGTRLKRSGQVSKSMGAKGDRGIKKQTFC